jgi:flagellar basal-body rod protein FlgC
MSIETVLEASRVGLNYERMRLDTASKNIASANQPILPGVNNSNIAAGGFADNLQSEVSMQNTPIATRNVYDPSNPVADSEGYVHYPDIDLAAEMTTLVIASRGYEANVRSFNMIRGMVMKALEIGAK